MRFLRQKLPIIFCVVFFKIAFGQETKVESVKLEWDTVPYIFEPNSINNVQVVKGNLLDDEKLPIYSIKIPILGNVELTNYTIENQQYIEEKSENYAWIAKNKIPTTLKYQSQVVKTRNESQILLQVTPIVYENGIVKKLVSFDFVYSLSNSNNSNFKTSSVKNSVLAEGRWYKFAIDSSGVYKIDKQFLTNLGINTNEIDPRRIKIYGNGGEMLPTKNSSFRYDDLQENAILVRGEEDQKFDDSDYILFYGYGPHTWKIDKLSLEEVTHEYNIYSDEAVYFLTIDGDYGRRIQNQTSITLNPKKQVTEYHDFLFYEKDEVNLLSAGQQWFGDSFNVNPVVSKSFSFDNVKSPSNLLVRVRGMVESTTSTSMQVIANNQQVTNINFSGISGLTKAQAIEGYGYITANENVTVDITFSNNGNPSAKAYLDYIEILGTKNLVATNKQFSFTNLEVNSSIGVYEFVVQNSSNIQQIWDVSTKTYPQNIDLNSTAQEVRFKTNGGQVKKYVVVAGDDYYVPKLLDNPIIPNQNLHAITDIEYLVITPAIFQNQAKRLAQFHETNSNLKTLIVTPQQIYNEFSSGNQDVTAIRDFIRHLYSNSSKKIKYVCLLGDASFDYKDRIGGNTNFVPTYFAYESFNMALSYVTDDFYGMMDDNEGELNSFDQQDVAIGRLPVGDIAEAESLVTKILSYYSTNSIGEWRNNITLIADDIDSSGDQIIQLGVEELAINLETIHPVFNLNKIYLDAYPQELSSGGSRYPMVNAEIDKQVERGNLIMNYFGHGGEGGLAAEAVLTPSQIQNYDNFDKLPLFITVTCQFARFDNPLRNTAGEYFILNKNGGVSCLISTAREVFVSVGQTINKELVPKLLQRDNTSFSIAENLMHTKNSFSTIQKYFIFHFGDPAMKLAMPEPNIRLLKMNDKLMNQSRDTIKALSLTKFEGEVTDESNMLLEEFNGKFDITIFDKPISKTTLDNDNKNLTMQFSSYESRIFKGRAEVVNGKFSFEFVAPKDLKIAYGTGKLSLYASDNQNDRNGFTTDIVIGGIDENAQNDTTGPTIQLFLNEETFVDGGITNSNPLLIAQFFDENGINTSLTAVDHDIVAIVDGDEANPLILNDFYQTEINDYKKGEVSYPLDDLEPGLHTIKLKAWDNYNNPSESTLSFFVVDDSELVLSNVLNYPNPFINYTEFWFNHNKPNQLLNVQVKIFTVSGKLIKTINESVQTNGNLSRTINWNGLDDFGEKIGKGVYIYRLKVVDSFTNQKAEKIEKLVILK